MVFGTFLLLIVSRIELILFPLDFYLSHERTQMEGKQLMEEAEEDLGELGLRGFLL